jgi:hypothetical protein
LTHKKKRGVIVVRYILNSVAEKERLRKREGKNLKGKRIKENTAMEKEM